MPTGGRWALRCGPIKIRRVARWAAGALCLPRRPPLRDVYGDWANICSQESSDESVHRRLDAGGRRRFSGRILTATRATRWSCGWAASGFVTIRHINAKGAVYARVSRNLVNGDRSGWSRRRGELNPRYAAECPFVVEPKPGEYYLFHTQNCGREALTPPCAIRAIRSISSAAKKKRGALCPIAAPEIFQHEGHWYLASLLALRGFRFPGWFGSNRFSPDVAGRCLRRRPRRHGRIARLVIRVPLRGFFKADWRERTQRST